MELISRAAQGATPAINRCLDVCCGDGNNIIKLLRANSGGDDVILSATESTNGTYVRTLRRKTLRKNSCFAAFGNIKR